MRTLVFTSVLILFASTDIVVADCQFVDPRISPSGYRRWCECMGGTYSNRDGLYYCDGVGSGPGPGPTFPSPLEILSKQYQTKWDSIYKYFRDPSEPIDNVTLNIFAAIATRMPPRQSPTTLTDLGWAIEALEKFIQGYSNGYWQAGEQLKKQRQQADKDEAEFIRLEAQTAAIDRVTESAKNETAPLMREIEKDNTQLEGMFNLMVKMDQESKTIAIRLLNLLGEPIPESIHSRSPEEVFRRLRARFRSPLALIPARDPLSRRPPYLSISVPAPTLVAPYLAVPPTIAFTEDAIKQKLNEITPTDVGHWIKFYASQDLNTPGRAANAQRRLEDVSWNQQIAMNEKNVELARLDQVKEHLKSLMDSLKKTVVDAVRKSAQQAFWRYLQDALNVLLRDHIPDPTQMGRFIRIQDDIIKYAKDEFQLSNIARAAASSNVSESDTIQNRMDLSLCQFISSFQSHGFPVPQVESELPRDIRPLFPKAPTCM